MFWACTVSGNKSFDFSLQAKKTRVLHITHAVLHMNSSQEIITLNVTYGKSTYPIAYLKKDAPMVQLDLYFDATQKGIFSIVGNAQVSILGYFDIGNDEKLEDSNESCHNDNSYDELLEKIKIGLKENSSSDDDDSDEVEVKIEDKVGKTKLEVSEDDSEDYSEDDSGDSENEESEENERCENSEDSKISEESDDSDDSDDSEDNEDNKDSDESMPKKQAVLEKNISDSMKKYSDDRTLMKTAPKTNQESCAKIMEKTFANNVKPRLQTKIPDIRGKTQGNVNEKCETLKTETPNTQDNSKSRKETFKPIQEIKKVCQKNPKINYDILKANNDILKQKQEISKVKGEILKSKKGVSQSVGWSKKKQG